MNGNMLTPQDFDNRQRDYSTTQHSEKTDPEKGDSQEKKSDATQQILQSPFSGFWLRVAAFLFDITFLFFCYHAIGKILKPIVFALGGLDYFIGVALFLLYFTLCEGPLGNGRTLGKAIFKLRVIDKNMQHISFGKSFLRSLRLAFIFCTFQAYPHIDPGQGQATSLHVGRPLTLLVFTPIEAIGFDEIMHMKYGGGIFYILINYLKIISQAMVWGGIFMIIQHPFKRMIHDELFGTLVIKSRQIENVPAYFEAGQTHANPRRSFGIGIMIAFALAAGSIFIFHKFQDLPTTKKKIAQERAYSETIKLKGATPVARYDDSIFMKADANAPKGLPAQASFFPAKNTELHKEIERIKKDIAELKKLPTAISDSDEATSAAQKLEINENLIKRLSRFQLYRVFYYHNSKLDEDLLAELKAKEEEIFIAAQQKYRNKQEPFVDTNSAVDDLPTSAVFYFGVIRNANFFFDTLWEEDYVSTRVLTLEKK